MTARTRPSQRSPKCNKTAKQKVKCKSNRKRKVTLDSNVLISYVVSKRDDTVIKKVVTKSVTDDRLMLTNIIYDECLGYADKKGARATKDEVSKKIKEISPDIIEIRRVPKDSKLSKKYKIRDVNDLKILYSADKTKSVILVTMDDDFSDVKGLKAKVMKPKDYLIEDKGRKKSKIRRE